MHLQVGWLGLPSLTPVGPAFSIEGSKTPRLCELTGLKLRLYSDCACKEPNVTLCQVLASMPKQAHSYSTNPLLKHLFLSYFFKFLYRKKANKMQIILK